MSPLFYIATGMLIAFVFVALILREKEEDTNNSNFLYNKVTNQIGLIIFEDKNKLHQDYYRVHTHGIWSKENCIRLDRNQCNKLLAMTNISWLHPTKPHLKTLNLI